MGWKEDWGNVAAIFWFVILRQPNALLRLSAAELLGQAVGRIEELDAKVACSDF